jgi:hypothetical protein
MNQLMTEDSDASADHVEGDFSVNPNRPTIDCLNYMKGGHSSIFESQTGYTFSEWDEFARRVVPELTSRAFDRHPAYSFRSTTEIDARAAPAELRRVP